jgi:hypothetical protein
MIHFTTHLRVLVTTRTGEARAVVSFQLLFIVSSPPSSRSLLSLIQYLNHRNTLNRSNSDRSSDGLPDYLCICLFLMNNKEKKKDLSICQYASPTIYPIHQPFADKISTLSTGVIVIACELLGHGSFNHKRSWNQRS